MRNARWWRTELAAALICVAGGALLERGTLGFRAFTSEQARRLAVARAPVSLPPAALVDQDGRPFSLAAYAGRPLAVDFVYTRCATVCPVVTATLQRAERAARAAGGADTALRFVSISFDPRDTPAQLRDFAGHYGADTRRWRFATVPDQGDLARLLRAFGVVVIPDGRGDFQHNAAVHLVSADGRLARVLDADAEPAAIVKTAMTLSSGAGREP